MTNRGTSASGRRLSAYGFLCLIVALGAAGALALQHLGAAPLPGCGLDSPCQRALSGPFGKLPGLDWPVAFAGAAWFAGLLAAWALAGSGWPRTLRWSARAGAVLSLVFLLLAFQQGTPCPFCIAAQVANLAFVVASERSSGPARARRPEMAFAGAALAVTAVLAFQHARVSGQRDADDERALAESTTAIEAGTGARAFTGRFRSGPERAPLRLVLFTDYQCVDCKRIEGEAWELHEARSDLSLSIKHFPLCRDCNRRARELDHGPHPNACWAARAAEAAGIVAGPAGFWRMHRWLFARGGAFTEAELRDGLATLAFPVGPFIETMHSRGTLARVEEDVEEALALGIQTTPMVFLNGVELRGWQAPAALRRAVEQVAASQPEAQGPESDRPPGALEKALADWRLEPVSNQLQRKHAHATRTGLEIVVWSDYGEESTRELDRRLRAFLGAHPDARYTFRHYPLDPECTPAVPAKHPGSCRLARAAEAARVVGGEEGFERFHAWLMERRGPLDDAALAAGAHALGLDQAAFLAALAGEATLATVRADVDAGRRLGLHSIPLLYVAGKRVPRWRLEGVELLEEILEAAVESP